MIIVPRRTDKKTPVIAVSDYVKLVAEQISAYVKSPFIALGTDGFGRSDTRKNLRDFFEINRYYITITAIKSLVKEGEMKKEVLSKAIEKYNINPDKINPLKI